jgi:hypothetical protein
MRWMIWPRQYGKTYQTGLWWLEDPQNRVILTENEKLAQLRREELGGRLYELHPEIPAQSLFMRQRIMSFRTWMAGVALGVAIRRGNFEVAVDGADTILAELLLGASIQVITGVGRNDEPDPGIAAQVDAFNAKWQHLMPPGIDPGLR